MGLDIYLYKHDNPLHVRAAYSRPRDDEDEIDALNEQRVEERPSVTDPEHINNLSYLRSSYNGGGYNDVAQQRGWPTYYDLFQPEGDDYIVIPNWADVKARVEAALAEAVIPEYIAFPLKSNMFSPPMVSSEREAVQTFLKVAGKNSKVDGFKSYSTKEGEFFLDGLTIHGVIYAAKSGPFDADMFLILKNPSLDKQDEENARGDHYLNSLKIVGEMVDFVLAQDDPQKYYLHWSG